MDRDKIQTLLWLTGFMGLIVVFFLLYTSIKSNASDDGALTQNQVNVTYYKGIPTSRLDDYETALSGGDTAIEKVTFTTKSLGRLSWGEPDSEGEYAMYFDAADIHRLAAYVNEVESKYEELYELYRKAASTLYD